MAINLDSIKAKLQQMQQASNGGGGNKASEHMWKPVVGKQRPSDITRFAVSPVRARIQLAWAPFTSLSQGLATVLPQL